MFYNVLDHPSALALFKYIFPSPISLCYHPLLFTARYFFPRQLLIPHFWTPRQQVEFRALYHSLRARHHWPVLRALKERSYEVKTGKLQIHLEDLCAKVSQHITVFVDKRKQRRAE